jgi:hypothetical protein
MDKYTLKRKFAMNKKVCELFSMSCFVLLFLVGTSIMVKQAMAQGQPSNQTEIIVAKTPEEKANLERFDKLDFEAWNNRNWTLFSNIHAQDVLVSDFNGNVTKGLDQHLQWAKNAVAFHPDSKIVSHPIKIAAGNWTAVTGTLPGNNTMMTLAQWGDGKITEEHLFSQMPSQ